MSSGSPIGCFSYCGCADSNTGYEWNLTLLASAGWDCSIAPATGYVTASAGSSGLSGFAGITISIGYGAYGMYLQTCDGFFLDPGETYTSSC